MKFNDEHKSNKNGGQNRNRKIGYYSHVLKEPFDSMDELIEAEEAYYAKLKDKEDKALQKKNDAKKVEEAFKALNTARKAYKNNLLDLTTRYSEELKLLKETFEAEKSKEAKKLSDAESTYQDTLKSFTNKYPEGYHLTLKDGDFETTIDSSHTTYTDNKRNTKLYSSILELFDDLFCN